MNYYIYIYIYYYIYIYIYLLLVLDKKCAIIDDYLIRIWENMSGWQSHCFLFCVISYLQMFAFQLSTALMLATRISWTDCFSSTMWVGLENSLLSTLSTKNVHQFSWCIRINPKTCQWVPGEFFPLKTDKPGKSTRLRWAPRVSYAS